MAYCTPDDVITALQARGLDPSAYETAAIQHAAELATRLVDAYTGRHFRAEPVTEGHEPLEGQVLLLHWPLRQVVSVTDAKTGEDVGYEVLDARIGLLNVYSSSRVLITYYYNDPDDPVPDDVKRATAEVAANILAAPPDTVQSLSDGGLSAGGDTALRYLTPSVRLVLTRYIHWGVR